MFELIHIFILTSYIYKNNPGKILQLAFLTYVKNMVKSIHIFKILWTDMYLFHLTTESVWEFELADLYSFRVTHVTQLPTAKN